MRLPHSSTDRYDLDLVDDVTPEELQTAVTTSSSTNLIHKVLA